MGAAAPIQDSFNSGLWGPRMQGRVTLQKYYSACETCQNYIPTVQGPAVKRPGTRHVLPAKHSDKDVRLIRFEFSDEQAYVLEFGDEYMRVHRNNGTVLNASKNISTIGYAGAGVLEVQTATNHGYTTGDTVFLTNTGYLELDDRYFTIIVTALDRFWLNETFDTITPVSGGPGTVADVYEISTPYDETDVAALQTDQSNDVLYIAHKSYQPRKLSRTSDTSWTLSTIEGDEPPWETENGDEDLTLEVSAVSGTSITVTAKDGGAAKADFFTSDMIGGWVRIREEFAAEYFKWQANTPLSGFGGASAPTIGSRFYYEDKVYELVSTATTNSGYDPPVHTKGTKLDRGWGFKFINYGYGYGKITAVGGTPAGSEATVDVDTAGVEFPESANTGGSGDPTFRWALSAWHDEYGYPRSVAFHEDRLCWGGTQYSPQAVWLSASGQYENYRTQGESAEALQLVLNTRKQNTIEWMTSVGDVLAIGTKGGEFTLGAANPEEGIGKDNFKSRPVSRLGSRVGVPALVVDSVLLFAQRAGRKVHEQLYDFGTDRYTAPDVTELSEEVLDGLVAGLEQQHEPYRQVWAWMEDGTLASCTYIREQQVAAWAGMVLGGANVKVLSCATIPHPDGDQDQLWMAVERTIDGSTVKYIEYLEKPWYSTDAVADAFFVDSGLTYNGTTINTVTGLEYLEGETVAVLADGKVHPQRAVSGGKIELDYPASKVTVGLPFQAKLRTMRIEAGSRVGTAQGKKKRIPKLVIRVARTGPGLSYGTDFDTMDEVYHFEGGDPMDTALDYLADGDTQLLDMPSGWEKEGWIALQHDAPTPCTILALMPQMLVSEGG